MFRKIIAGLASLALFGSQLSAQTIGPSPPASGNGTVTSVGVGNIAGVTTAGTPVTTTGTVTQTLNSQSANTVFAAPNGSAGAPTFRAPVIADISNLGTGVGTALGSPVTGTGALVLNNSPTLITPNLGTPSAATLTNATGLPLTSGVTGILPVANGGTNCNAASVTCAQNIVGSQSANAFFGGPSSGSGAATFRGITGPDLFGVLAAPVNLAPNSQWEIMSGWSFGTQENYQGTGTVNPIIATANTTGTIGRSTFTVSTTNDLSVGDLIKIQTAAGVDACFEIGPMRIVALVANTSITLRTPLGCTPTVTNNGTSLTPITAGNLSANNTGAGPDGWIKTTTLPMWRNENRGSYAANMPTDIPAYATLGMNKDIAGAEQFYIQVPTSQLQQYQGRNIVFGIQGYQKVRGGAGTWTIFTNDSVNGVRTPCSNAPTTGTFNWLECSVSVPAGTTYLYVGVQLNGALADTYYFANPVFAIGNFIGGARNYQKPRNEILIPTVHISPYGWINSAVTFPSSSAAFCAGLTTCFEHDPYAETGGAVAMTVQKIHGQNEGWNCGTVVLNSGNARLMAWYDRASAPEKSGSFLPQYVACAKSFMYMDMPLNQYTTSADVQGTGVFVSGVVSDAWANVSLEYDWFILN